MLIALDVGNTNVTVALYSGESMLHCWRLSSRRDRTTDEYGTLLLSLLHTASVNVAQVKHAIVASVVPAANRALGQALATYLNLSPRFVSDYKESLGIRIKIDQPHEAGADRLVNAVAARQHYTKNVLIIDFGTATTFDLVDEQGDYAGGVISPGIQLSMEALHQRAAKLPAVAIQPPAHVIGKNTVAAMQSGLFYGYLGLTEGLITRIQAEHGSKLQVIATGGLGELFSQHSAMIDEYAPDLTMRGLYLIHNHLVENHPA